MTVIFIIGSVASVLSLFVSLYVLMREIRIADEVHALKSEEEVWHEEGK